MNEIQPTREELIKALVSLFELTDKQPELFPEYQDVKNVNYLNH